MRHLAQVCGSHQSCRSACRPVQHVNKSDYCKEQNSRASSKLSGMVFVLFNCALAFRLTNTTVTYRLLVEVTDLLLLNLEPCDDLRKYNINGIPNKLILLTLVLKCFNKNKANLQYL